LYSLTRTHKVSSPSAGSHLPFDKIIVTCGIDHIPPPLLQQLRTGGIMVIPIGPPGAQHILKVVKKTDEGGGQSVSAFRHIRRQGHPLRAAVWRAPAARVTQSMAESLRRPIAGN
jgi:protein-L-isoaspartate O-methyltransferase